MVNQSLRLAAWLALVLRADSLSSRGAQATNNPPPPFAVYGVMTNGQPAYQAKLLAQIDTWAYGLPERGRFFAVAGKGAEQVKRAGLIVEERCSDGRGGIACKEERLLEEGYLRKPEWFVILGEDNYVNSSRMEDELRQESMMYPDTPRVVGLLGCGQDTGDRFCAEVSQKGGLCGGGSYAINRAAMEALFHNGQDALRQEYAAYGPSPGDMASSCSLMRRGVAMGQIGGLAGNRIERKVEFKHVLQGKPAVLHYCTPDVMRWVSAWMTERPATEVQSLEAAAFPNGCCCSYRDSDLLRCEAEVHESTVFLSSTNGPADFAALAKAYVQERNEQLALPYV